MASGGTWLQGVWAGLGFLLALTALLAAACSSPATPTPYPLPTPTATPPPTPTVTATPPPTARPSPTPTFTPVAGRRGGVISVMASAPYSHLDVHQDISESLASLGPGLAYSRLLRLRTGPEVQQPSLEVQCELCTGWEMEDPQTYVFHLREDVRWQDLEPVKRRPLTASDLVFSYNRQRTPGWPNAELMQSVQEVTAPDDHTLRVTLKYPDADILLALADGHSKVVAREVVESYGSLKGAPVVGSGPWVWQAEPGGGSLLQRNGAYFEEGVPLLDRMAVRVIEEEQSRFAAFATGTADVFVASPAYAARVQERSQEWTTYLSRQAGTGVVLALNTSRPPFDNATVRKAALKALDPWAYVREVWHGLGFVSLGVPVEQAQWLLPEEELRRHLADPAEAKRLLDSMGVFRPLRFGMTVGDFGPEYLTLAQRVEEDLKKAGFDLYTTQVNPTQYAETVWRQGDYQISLGALPPTSTPNSYLFPVLHTGGRWNLVDHQDRELDRLIEAQAVETDPQARRELLVDIQRRLLEQAYLLVPVTGSNMWVAWPHVKGLYPNTALSEYFYWAKVWLER